MNEFRVQRGEKEVRSSVPIDSAEKSMKTEAERQVERRSCGDLSWLTVLWFTFVLFISHSNGDAAAEIAFVCLSCLDLVMGFWFKRAAPGSPTRARLKVAVWVLTTLLTLASSYKVVSITPLLQMATVVSWMAATIVLRGLYAFFMHRKDVALAENFSLWLLQTRPLWPKYMFSNIMDVDEFRQNSAHSDRCMKRCHCLRWFKREAPGSSTKAQLKVAVSVLTTTLITIVFSFKVAAIRPVPVQIILFAGMATAIVRGGFYAFFTVNKEEKIKADDAVAATLWYKIRSVVASVVFSGLHLLVLFSCYLLWFPAALLGRLWTGCRRRSLAISSRIRTTRAGPGAGLGRAYDDPRDVAWSVARLVLDSGATGHAVGNILLLVDFLPYSPPRFATLADGTTNLSILGSGLIESRDTFRIPNVDLVQGLQDGLISIRQLDRDHGLVSCFGNGICRIMMTDGTEVGGASLAEDGSYVLRYLLVPAGPTQVQ